VQHGKEKAYGVRHLRQERRAYPPGQSEYEKGKSLLLIENVPVVSCPHCRESCLAAETLHEIERIKLHRQSYAVKRQVAVAGFPGELRVAKGLSLSRFLMRINSVGKRLEEYRARPLDLLNTQAITTAELLGDRGSDDCPGVYAISTPVDDRMVYAGRTKSKSIAGRIADHRNTDAGSDLRGMLKRNPQLPQRIEDCRVRYVGIRDDRDRLFFEYFAIGCLAPALNT